MRELASLLRGTQGDLLAAAGADRLTQPGAECLAGPFEVPRCRPGDPVEPRGEPCLETFVVSSSTGGELAVEPTGPDPSVAAWWRPAVERLARRVMASAEEAGVELGLPLYVTASTSELADVAREPHLDDDQVRPSSGLGLVAVAATHLGPRVARGEVGRFARPVPAPIEIDPVAVAPFAEPAEPPGGPGSGSVVVEQWPAERIVVFARFGQLHAGPVLDPAATGADAGSPPEAIRSLLVLRADTVPVGPGA